jgi:dTDP-4-dehydrorhamnose reductase
MKIFLTGATGLFGRYFLESDVAADNCEILALSKTLHAGLNWRTGVRAVGIHFENRKSIGDLLRQFSPDWVIHAGAESNVDRVENDTALASSVNLEFPLFLMEEAWKIRAHWATFSSNAIYGGDRAPYSEASEAQPINNYGRLKAQVDAQTRSYPGHWVIFRPTVSYGWNYQFARSNPVTYFLPLMQQGRDLKLVDDQFENPVYADDVAKVMWHVISNGFQGEINVAGGDSRVSRYDWIRAVARAFEFDQDRIAPSKLADFVQSAPRPRDTSFDTFKLIRDLKQQTVDVFEGALRMKMDTKRRWC